MPKLNAEVTKKVKNTDPNPFAPLPEGYYKVKLTKVESGKSKAGKPMWTWTYKSVAPVEGKELKEFTVIQDNVLWKLAQIFEAFGAEPNVSTDTLIGKTVMIEVNQEVQAEGKGKGRLRHIIAGYPDPATEPRLFEAEAELPGDSDKGDDEPEVEPDF